MEPTVDALALLDGLALAAIAGYQRWISPYKGFRCAYRAHTGRCSCSQLGWRAIRRFGTIEGVGVLRKRLFRCGVACRRYGPVQQAPRQAVPPRGQSGQRGDCDVIACVPVDAPCEPGDCAQAVDIGRSCSPSPCDLLNCSGHARSSRRDDRNDPARVQPAPGRAPDGDPDASVHLPPRRRRE